MSDYVTNILRFKGRPFAKDLPLIIYHPESGFDYYEIGGVVRNLRRIGINRIIPIIQSGTDIISIQELEDNDNGWLKPFELEKKTINASLESDRRLIRQLIAESVAVKLRNKPEEKWIIGQISNEVYEVKRKDELERFGRIAVYPGYRFSALVRANGEVGLVLDPIYKFHSVYNLRELYQRGDRLLRDLFSKLPLPYQDDRAKVVDICPLENCPEKDDPLSACRLAGIGSTARLVGVQEKKPSDIQIPYRKSATKINLIEYHDTEVCIRGMRFISDISPVAEVRYRGSKRYCLPLERLRLTPTFDILNESDRSAVMNRIRPNPRERLKRTRAYIRDLGDLPIGNYFDIEQDNLEKKWSARSSEVHHVLYEVGGNATGEYPEIRIGRNGPYDLNNNYLRTANIAIVYSTSQEPSEVKLISEVLTSVRSKVATIYQYLRMKCKIVDVIRLESSNYEEVIEVLTDLNEKMPNFLTILLFSDQGDKKALENIADALIMRQIPKQGINQKEFRSKYEDRKRGYFNNLFLGIYAKIGGQPWILRNVELGFERFTGLSSRYEDEYLYISLCQYSSRGEFLEGMCRKIHRDTLSDELLKELSRHLQKNEVLMKAGSFYSIESEVIEKLSRDSSFKAVEIIKSFPIRIYGMDESSDKMPELGRSVWLSDREVALVTTVPRHGTPNPLYIRNVTLKDNEFDAFIPLAFNLTQCHIGYAGIRIRDPMPCHASSKALTGFVQLGVDKLDFVRPWFI